MNLKVIALLIFSIFVGSNCTTSEQNAIDTQSKGVANSLVEEEDIKVGAANINQYYDLIKDKNIALVVNQTSMIGNTHLADTLLGLGISLSLIHI